MNKDYLRQCKAAARNATVALFGTTDDPDVIEKVIADVEQRHPAIYKAAIDERGKMTVHQQMAKEVKRTLRAKNDGRSASADSAPSKTHQRLKRD